MAGGIRQITVMIGLLGLLGCAGRATLPSTDVSIQRSTADQAYLHGDIGRAASLYQSLVTEQPDDADLWYRLGNARFRLRQSDDAVAAYEHALRIKPDHARALYNMGVVRLKQAQAAMLASAEAGKPGDSLRRDSGRIAERLAKVGDDMSSRTKGDGGAPPFIVDTDGDP